MLNSILLQSVVLIFPVFLASSSLILRHRSLDPIRYIIFFFVYGATFKVLYLNWISENRALESKMLAAGEPEILIDGLIVLVSSLIVLIFVYIVVIKIKACKEKPIQFLNSNPIIFHFVVITLLVTSVSGFILFVSLSETSFSLDNFIGKRFSTDDSRGSERVFQSGYMFYRLALLAKVSFVIVFISYLYKRKSSLIIYFYLVLSFFMALVVPIYFSNRFGALLVIVDLFIIYVVVKKKASFTLIISSSIFIFVFLLLISVFRFRDGGLNQALDHVIAGRYMFDLYKISSIINYYLEGSLNNLTGISLGNSSLISGLLNIGDVIANDVYSEPTNSVPPGVIPEVFIKHGWLGLICTMSLIGFFLAVANIVSKSTSSLAIKIILQMLIFRIVFLMSNNDLTTLFLKPLGDLLPTLIAALVVFSCYDNRRIVASNDSKGGKIKTVAGL